MKRGAILGIANEHSLAWGCAKVLQNSRLALSYLNDKAKPYVEPLATAVNAEILMPLDVHRPEEMEAFFTAIQEKWGSLDFLIHSLAYCSDLNSHVIDISLDSFTEAMNISCYSFIKSAHYAAQLMKKGGSVLTMTYYGSQKVVSNYKIMGPIKAALESTVRSLASELGPQNIRVNALSPGPLLTRAASGIQNFQSLIGLFQQKAPLKKPLTIDDVGYLARFLIGDESQNITGNTFYIDNGFHIMA